MRNIIVTAILLAAVTQNLAASDTNLGPRRERDQSAAVEMAWSGLDASAGAYAQSDEQSSARSSLSPRTRMLLGVLVPGLPQYLDGRSRAWGYFAVEGISIAALFALNAHGNSFVDRYRNLAQTARGNFVYPGLRNNPTEEVDVTRLGYGEYYEDLLKWHSSGDYDNDPNQPGVQPETDTRTYNGHQWEIAQINNYSKTSGGFPVAANQAEIDAAVESYKQRVYPVELNWDWTGLETGNADYHRYFDVSERAYRNRNKFITVMVANHLISLFDVLITEKINSNSELRRNDVRLGLELYAPEGYPYGQVMPLLTVSKGF